MEDFVLGLEHRTVLRGKQSLMRRQQNIPSPGWASLSGSQHLHVYTLADNTHPRKHAAFIIYLHSRQTKRN